MRLTPIILKRFVRAALILPLLFIGAKVQANHIFGADISYRSLDTFKFEVTFTLYRECRGVGLSNPSPVSYAQCVSSGLQRQLSFTLISIEDISPVRTSPGPCGSTLNINGTNQGLERHTYKDTVDFNDSIYNVLKSCCEVSFYYRTNYRSSSISTGSNNTTMFVESTINLCKSNNNNSPVFKFNPVANVCCNSSPRLNPGVCDTNRLDSLSFSLLPPFSNRGISIPYNTYANCQIWTEAYFPGTLPCSYINQNSTTPIGMYFNKETGQMIFTSTDCSGVSPYVIETEQWRRNGAGGFDLVGKIRREIAVISQICTSYETPIIDVNESYDFCAGELNCFDIKTDHPDATDSTFLTWNEVVTEASFEIINKDSLNETGRFCWTPSNRDARSNPYLLAVESRDDHSPLNRTTQKSIKIKVHPQAKSSKMIKSLGCNAYEVASTLDSSSFSGAVIVEWTALDSAHNPLTDYYGRFESNNNTSSYHLKDTIRFQQAGTYVIKYQIGAQGTICNRVVFDTISVGSTLSTYLSIRDTTVCINNPLQLDASVFNNSGNADFNWYVNQNSLIANSSMISFLADTLGVFEYKVEVTDNGTCKAVDKMRLVVVGVNSWNFSDTTIGCGQPVTLKTIPSFTDITWNTAAKTSNITVTNQGLYWYNANDAYSCEYTDSTWVNLYDIVKLELRDTFVCGDSFNVDPGSYASYQWSNATTNRIATFYTQGNYSLTVIDSNGCEQMSSMSFQINPNPVDSFAGDMQFCCNSPKIALNALLGSADEKGGTWTIKNHPQAIVSGFLDPEFLCTDSTISPFLRYRYTYQSTGCYFDDSLQLTVYPKPELVLNDWSACQTGEEIVVNSELISSPEPLDGIQNWSCIKCNGVQLNAILVNDGSTSLPNYKLLLDSNNYSVNNSGQDTFIFKLVYTTTDGCIDSAQNTVKVLAPAPKPILKKQHQYIWVSNPSHTVKWFKNGVHLSGYTDTIIDATALGKYKVQNITKLGCESELSDEIERTTGIDELNHDQLTLFPNPTGGELMLSFDQAMSISSPDIKMFNNSGQEVNLKIELTSQGYNIHFDPVPGFYILEVNTAFGTVFKKVIAE